LRQTVIPRPMAFSVVRLRRVGGRDLVAPPHFAPQFIAESFMFLLVADQSVPVLQDVQGEHAQGVFGGLLLPLLIASARQCRS